jgi:outer membrane protein OmpA-like peptidoglycan-associated protein
MRGRARAAVVGGGAGLAVALAQPGSATADDALIALASQPLPLAIHDGRVAQLTVHAVPFTIGSQELTPATVASLDELVAGAATDCFVTAQAVGHVRPGTPGDGGTLVAHRLARARAEAVKSALVRGGLPEGSVASVWDYQFSVREPRVTLWIFQLPKGEACSGMPLPGAPVRMALAMPELSTVEPVADVSLPANATAPVDQRQADRQFKPAPGIHMPDRALQADGAEVVPHAIPSALAETRPMVPFERPPQEFIAVPDPAAPPAAHVADGAVQLMAVATAAPQAEPVAADAGPPPAVQESAVSVEILFAENSSFFPPEAPAELQRFAAALPPGRRWEIELQAAVDDKARRRDSPEKAQAYNGGWRTAGRGASWSGWRSSPSYAPLPLAAAWSSTIRRAVW